MQAHTDVPTLSQLSGVAGKSVGSVPAGTGQGDAVPSADTTPAATEQQAVDESYKSGDSPYEFSKVLQTCSWVLSDGRLHWRFSPAEHTCNTVYSL